MSPKRRRRRVEPTDDWEQLELLCARPDRARYELIRPMVLFGMPAAERSRQTGAASERSLYRRTGRFDEEGVEQTSPWISRRKAGTTMAASVVYPAVVP